MAKEEKRHRWVKYPCIIAGEMVWRAGLFEVTYIDGTPAWADAAGPFLGIRHSLEYYRIKVSIERAAQEPEIICTCRVDLDNVAWDGRLIFEHAPILS